MDTIFQAILDEDRRIVSLVESNVAQQGAVEISAELYREATSLVGRVRLVDGELVEADGPPTP